MNDPNPIATRPATPDDVATLADFNLRMAMETEHKELDLAVLTPGVAAILADAAKGHYTVATVGGAVVGCLLITHEWSDWRNGDIWWIQSVYVLPEHRGRGVFRALYQTAETSARAAGAVGLRLYVERDNAAAQATYQKLGMSVTDYKMMEAMF